MRKDFIERKVDHSEQGVVFVDTGVADRDVDLGIAPVLDYSFTACVELKDKTVSVWAITLMLAWVETYKGFGVLRLRPGSEDFLVIQNNATIRAWKILAALLFVATLFILLLFEFVDCF